MSTGARRGGQGAGVTVRCAPTLPCPRSFTICHKTEVVKNTLNPVWQPFTIPVRALCNGDYDRYGDGDMGSRGARAGYEHLFAGLALQRQAAQNWVLIGFFFLFCNPNYIKASPSFPGPPP